MQPNPLSLLRSQDARAVFGNLPTSTFYEHIERGLMTPGVAIGARSVAWPAHECQAIAAARIAGKNEADIKALVQDLVAARATLADKVAA
jgi:prophage regulatory protein